jgi:hypothetical protein
VATGFGLGVGASVVAWVDNAWRDAEVTGVGRATVVVVYRVGKGLLDERLQRVTVDRVRLAGGAPDP